MIEAIFLNEGFVFTLAPWVLLLLGFFFSVTYLNIIMDVTPLFFLVLYPIKPLDWFIAAVEVEVTPPI